MEMLIELDEGICGEVELLSRERLLNVEYANNWNICEHYLETLIPKPMTDATLLSNLSPKAVLPVMCTWYYLCLGLLCQAKMKKCLVNRLTK